MNYKINHIQSKFSRSYDQLWSDIIEPNQKLINSIDDYQEGKTLQEKHNKLCSLINEQYDSFYALLNELDNSIDKREFEIQKRYILRLKKYIRDLGGNPSNVNFSTDNDL